MKKVFALTILLMLGLMLVSGCYGAAAGGGSTTTTKEVLQNVFTLKFLSDIGLVKETTDMGVAPLVGFIRFLILILLFTIFFKGAELLKLGKNTAVIIAAVFALISAIFIPGTILLAAATSYATIVSLVILGIPVAIAVGGYFLLKEHHWIRVAVMGMLAVVMWEMGYVIRGLSATLSQESAAFTPIIGTVDAWNGWVFGLVIVLAVLSLFKALSGVGGASEYRPNWLGRLKDRVLQTVPGTDRHLELRGARRTETRELNDLITERQLDTDLGGVIAETEPLTKDFSQIIADTAVPDNTFIPVMKTHLDESKSKWEHLKKDEHKWKRAQRREVAQIKRLIGEMHKAHVSEKTIGNIESQEKLVLNDFIRVEKLFGDAEKALKVLEQAYGEIEKGLVYPTGATPADLSRPLLIASLTPAVQAKVNKALTVGGTGLNVFITSLESARKADEDAIKKTAILAEEIKTNWVLPPK